MEYYLSKTRYHCVYKAIQKTQNGIFAAVYDGENISFSTIPYNRLARVYSFHCMVKDFSERYNLPKPVTAVSVQREIMCCKKLLKKMPNNERLKDKIYWLAILLSRMK